MTVSQSVQLDTFDFGSSLGTVTLHDPETDDLIANGTADSSNELSVDSGTYLIVWTGVDASELIPAGVYRVRTTIGGSPLKRFITLAGVDGELVYARAERAAELDSASIAAIQSGLATSSQISALSGTTVQVASPNVQGNLVLTQGDDYDGIANPRASWTVSTDYTDGWSVTLTIRDADDAVIYTTSGEVVSSTVVAVTIEAPTGLTMTGCPGQWQGKFDVELTKSGSKKTIALGVCYINEDQTR